MIVAAIWLYIKFAIGLLSIALILDMITGFFFANSDEEDDPRYEEIQSTIMGNVYYGLLENEASWAHYLKFELIKPGDALHLDFLSGKYSDWLPDGNVDFDHFRMSSEDYVTEIIETEYQLEEWGEGLFDGAYTQSGAAKGPEPFPNAPEGSNTIEDPGAYKWIRLLDGGVEVRFRGIGDVSAGLTSNVKEIVAMAMTAQTQSDKAAEDYEYAEDDLGESNNFLKKAGVFASRAWNAIKKFVSAAVQGIARAINNLLRTIPAYDDWWVQQVEKQRTKMYMLYCAPLFNYSHTEEYSLQMALHPTLRTMETWAAEHPETLSTDQGEQDTAYTWGEMCSGIVDQRETDLTGYYDEAAGDYLGTKTGPRDKVPSGKPNYHGYGCKEFDQFAYKYDSDNDLYYEDEYCPSVEPAAKASPEMESDVCVAPGSDGERWVQVTVEYGNSDCWLYVGVVADDGNVEAEATWSPDEIPFVTEVVGDSYGYSEIYSPDGGMTYVVKVLKELVDSYTDENGVEHNIYHVYEYAWSHNCQADHTGYYCGGHFKVIVTGGVYHMTKAMRIHDKTQYTSKMTEEEEIAEAVEGGLINEHAAYDDEGNVKATFHTLYDNETGEPFYVEYVGGDIEEPTQQARDASRDLFDVDASFTHKYGTVSKWSPSAQSADNFIGWDIIHIDSAASKLDDNWEDL